MGKDDVAVLDTKRLALVALDKGSVANNQNPVQLPRMKRNVDVPSPSGIQGEILATVDLWHLGFKYNMNRALGKTQELYVLSPRNILGKESGKDFDGPK